MKRSPLSFATAVIALAGCHSSAPLPPLLETPAWGKAGALFLRFEASGSDLLLREEQGAVYRYDVSSKALTAETIATWDSGGELVACERQRVSTSLSYDINTGEYRLGKRALVLTGKYGFSNSASPTRGRMLVLSSLGPSRSSLPMLSAGLEAPYFYDVFSMPAGTPTGLSGKLPFPSTSWVTGCWSPDQRFIVVTDLMMKSLVVLPALVTPDSGALP